MKNVTTVFADLNTFKSNPNHYTKLITAIPPFDVLDKDNIERQIINKVFWCLVLENGEPATCCRISNLGNKKTIYINRQINTLPKFQGKGYGTLCLLASEKHLQKIGCRKLISFVDSENIASMRLHAKAGYEKVDRDSMYKKSRYSWKSAIMFEKALTRQQIEENSIIKK